MALTLPSALAPYAARYASDDPAYGRPLVVTVVLLPGSALLGYDPLNLDNLLARAVVDEALAGRGLPQPPPGTTYRLPVPLRCLWRDEQGLPLWAATPFAPAGAAAHDVLYRHKRWQPAFWTAGTRRDGRFTILPTDGRWMERRVPQPAQVAERFVARAVGDPVEVARLLGRITHVGGRRAAGLGAVARWEVAEDGAPFALVADGGDGPRLTRALPAAAVRLLEGGLPDGPPALVGWTPPYWRWKAAGWWPGTPVTRGGDDGDHRPATAAAGGA
jgi:hypothetical protein